MASDRQVAGELMREVLAGAVDVHDAEARFPGRDGDDRSLHTALHALEHFRQDSDIRARDERYSEMQVSELERIAACLEQGHDVDTEIMDALEPRPGCLFGLLGSGRHK